MNGKVNSSGLERPAAKKLEELSAEEKEARLRQSLKNRTGRFCKVIELAAEENGPVSLDLDLEGKECEFKASGRHRRRRDPSASFSI